MLTQLHTCRKKIITRLTGVLSTLMLSLPVATRAQTIITDGSTNICTNYAADGVTPYYRTLNIIALSETNTNDFGNAGFYNIDITLTAPAGWEFNSSHSPNITLAPSGNIIVANISSFTSSTLNFSVFGVDVDAMDEIVINGLQARQTSTSSAAGDVILSFTGDMAGLVGGESVATLSPEIPVAGATAAPLTGVSSTNICAGDNVDFSATASTAFEPGFQWHINGGDIAGETNSTYSSTTLADNDDVSVTVLDHTCIVSPTATSSDITMTVRPLPTAITGMLEICADGSSTLSSSPASGTWTSTASTVASIDATTGLAEGVEEGNATISYEAPNGCFTSSEMTVNPLPSTIDGTMQACVGNSETLSNDDLGGTWESSSTSVATIGTDGTVSGIMDGTTTITYTLATGCQRTDVFTVNALPVVFNVTGSGSYCAGGSGLAVGLDNTATGHTYDLYNGSTLVGSVMGSGAAVSFGTYTAATTFTATATNNITGCMNNMNGDATLTITPLSTPGVAISYTADTVCDGTVVTFTATPVNGGTAPTYTWAVNSTPMGTGNTYNYTPANGDIVSVVLTTNVTCPSTTTASDDFAMVVYSNETPAVSITASNTSVCQYTPVTYTVATSANGGTTPVYTWYKGSVSTGITGTSYTYQPADNDVISVKLNSSYRCPTANNVASNNITMNVDSIYVPAVTITTNTGLEMTAGETVTFTAHVTKAGAATPLYQWFVNKVAINGATTSTYTSSSIMNNDSVSCRVRAAGICNDATPTFNSVRMKYEGATFVHSTFENANVQLMPNPNNGTFFIRGTLNTNMDTDVQLEVTNMVGQVVYTNNLRAINGNIDTQVSAVNGLSNGTYLLTLQAGADRKTFLFSVRQ